MPSSPDVLDDELDELVERLENKTLIDDESYAEIVAISFTIPFCM
jgi:SOS response regulatory protein OraA/RecX